MLRREVLAGLAALALAPRRARAAAAEPGLATGAPKPFSAADVVAKARHLAESAYRPGTEIPRAWTDITYDQYRQIWFDSRNALWEGAAETPIRLDVFAPGLYFPRPIVLNVVEDGQSAPLLFDMNVFDTTDQFPPLPIDDTLGYSGFRLRAELKRPGIYQEFAVFQGASYFRAIGTGQIYGLSARGLAIDTAEPQGEEFPEFREYWIERPDPGAESVTLHALLDTPSCTGAYRFDVTPGETLTMQVAATLFPRRQIRHLGVAPLTSMFTFDQTNRDRFSDFRPAVHDSDGLLIVNGSGETIWRPLANPHKLQISAFRDKDPKGFGLMQRARTFGDFADLEALYHRRPGLWVEPGEGWGTGAVTLVEIPTDREIYDNIVAYWRPDNVIESEHRLTYRLSWGERSNYGQTLRVLNTAMGARHGGGYIVAIDFEDGPGVPQDLGGVEKLIRSSAGTVSTGVLQRNPETGGPRLAFTFDPEGADLVEFRAQLRRGDASLSEVWLYRWTR